MNIFYSESIQVSKSYLTQLKSRFTCSRCSKYYKKPIVLPCGHSICNEHLDEAKLNQTKIVCAFCRKDFDLTKHVFTPNLAVQIDDESLLNENERSLKSILIDGFKTFHKLDQEFKQAKLAFSNYELKCHEHFQDMRRQIDLHREESPKVNNLFLMKKLDATSLAMIEQTKDFERTYYENLKEPLQILLYYNSEEINVADETKMLNELFRNPHLKLSSMGEMQTKQKVKINQMKANLDKLLAIKNHLDKNQFIPILDNGTMFGTLTLYDYKSNLSTSHILIKQQAFDLMI